jgi:hypothetical protein
MKKSFPLPAPERALMMFSLSVFSLRAAHGFSVQELSIGDCGGFCSMGGMWCLLSDGFISGRKTADRQAVSQAAISRDAVQAGLHGAAFIETWSGVSV